MHGTGRDGVQSGLATRNTVEGTTSGRPLAVVGNNSYRATTACRPIHKRHEVVCRDRAAGKIANRPVVRSKNHICMRGTRVLVDIQNKRLLRPLYIRVKRHVRPAKPTHSPRFFFSSSRLCRTSVSSPSRVFKREPTQCNHLVSSAEQLHLTTSLLPATYAGGNSSGMTSDRLYYHAL